MNKTPEISLIMSVYNGEDYLAETLDSILAQTFDSWELVVINDCSTDSTAEILEKYALKDERVKVYPNEVNLRLPKSLNRAISLSQGKYIARMDADDICMSDRLEKQYAYMEANPDVHLSSCKFFTLKNGVCASGGSGGRCDFNALKAMLLVTNPILHPGVIARAEVMRELLYDTTLTCTEDLDLWTRMVSKGYRMEILPEYLLMYRLHDKQITSTTLERQHKEVVGIQKKFFDAMLTVDGTDMWDYYINGIYFKEKFDAKAYADFFKWIKASSAKNFDIDDIKYAMFEVLAEHRRHGIYFLDLMRSLLALGPIFVAKEMSRRKSTTKKDNIKLNQVAERLGLIRTAGNDEYPIFTRVK